MPANAGIYDFAGRTKASHGYRHSPEWRGGDSRSAHRGNRKL